MTARHAIGMAALLAWWAGDPATVTAQTVPAPRVEVSFAAGVFSPASSSVEAVYTGTRIPLVLDADVRVAGWLSLFASGRSLTLSGRPAPVSGGAASPSEAELTVRGMTAGARAHYRRGRFDVFTGIGIFYWVYEESWRDVGESVSGSVAGPTLHAGASIAVHRRAALFGRIDWTKANTGEGSLLSREVDLGGVDVLGGLAVRF